jgi:hypothetical protein
MPIKVMFSENGPFALVDTPEEALALLKANHNGTGQLAFRTATPAVTSDSISKFFSTINENAKKFLMILAKHPDGVKGETFAQETGFAVEKFGGILGGASKIAKNSGIAFKKMVISEMRTEGAHRYRFLRPGALLVQHSPELERTASEVK